MLAFARKKASKWIAIALLGLVLVAMVVTGFGTDGMGGLGGLGGGGQSGERLARVDGRSVTEPELNDLINRQFNQARQQQPTLTMAAFLEMGAFEGLLNQLVTGAAIQGFGEGQGLTVSQRMVDREIVNIPAFRNFTGQFDENTFRQALQSQNITEAALRQDISRALMQRQLLGPIALGARAPDGVAREYANLLLERRRGTIGVVPAELLAQGINPTDAQIAAFYTRNRSRFALPERRVVRYAMIGRERIAAQARATDAEIAAYYRENQAQFGPSQTRSLQQVVLPDQNAANAFVQRVRGGASFADAAAQAGFSAQDITFPSQSQQQFTEASSADVARQAFAAAQDALVGPVRTELGFHVVRVVAIENSPARPLQNVRAEIAQAIEQRKTADLMSALVTRVEDGLAERSSMEEVARANGLQLVTTPPITAAGQVIGQTWVLPPELQPLLRAAFEIDPEDPEPVVETVTPNERFALVGVDRVIPSAAPPLVQIRDQVRAAVMQELALARARQVAQGIVDQINRGTAPAQAFSAAQPRIPAPQSVDMRRLEISRGGQQVPPPLLALFTLPQGRARIVPAPNGAGWFIVHHAERTAGDASEQPQLIATTRNEFSSSAAEEMAQQFARAVEARTQVERNQDAIQRMRARLAGNALQ
ncbi:SurA N-terminal domain-containing protein [Sphingosinicella sp. LHD-64]|uniref:peptidylprolyl isomerase n=1 Tax=Sphingosinicella sp. LHD-64 TaxID=3072139 RepID=UPI00280F0392|nr:SurA N-terminal domain-containing protein [Sphingosinicella sp. LHD-64]MDQ8757966.1 SurA N-terminal domain-containing protein [Sphingosinicella sp. LHD-64]